MAYRIIDVILAHIDGAVVVNDTGKSGIARDNRYAGAGNVFPVSGL
jgi:hypothetical protein